MGISCFFCCPFSLNLSFSSILYPCFEKILKYCQCSFCSFVRLNIVLKYKCSSFITKPFYNQKLFKHSLSSLPLSSLQSKSFLRLHHLLRLALIIYTAYNEKKIIKIWNSFRYIEIVQSNFFSSSHPSIKWLFLIIVLCRTIAYIIQTWGIFCSIFAFREIRHCHLLLV